MKYKNITVYCASSKKVQQEFLDEAFRFGEMLGASGRTLIFGGTGSGSMLAVASGVKRSEGKVIGIIPKSMYDKGLAFSECDELIVEENLRTRKELLISKSDCLVALPGGIGTLDELMEVLASKQCKEHNKKIFILNSQNYFEPLLQMFEKMKKKGFSHEGFEDNFIICTSLENLLNLL